MVIIAELAAKTLTALGSSRLRKAETGPNEEFPVIWACNREILPLVCASAIRQPAKRLLDKGRDAKPGRRPGPNHTDLLCRQTCPDASWVHARRPFFVMAEQLFDFAAAERHAILQRNAVVLLRRQPRPHEIAMYVLGVDGRGFG
jgi:hypothetical protein